jgi:hypothetical protein
MPIQGRLAIAAALVLCASGVAGARSLASSVCDYAGALEGHYGDVYRGGLEFDGAVPVTGATVNSSVPVATYYHALNLFGRALGKYPCLVTVWEGNLQGHVVGAEAHLYRYNRDSWILFTVFR